MIRPVRGLELKIRKQLVGRKKFETVANSPSFRWCYMYFFLLNSSNLPWLDRPVRCSKPCSLLEKAPVMSFLSLGESAFHASLSWLLSAHAREFIANHIYLESFWITGLVSCQVHPQGA